jgi:hypothetical protein
VVKKPSGPGRVRETSAAEIPDGQGAPRHR